jgi:hypothetical protein
MNLFDLALIAVYLVGITLFGLRFRKKQSSLRAYFLADRNIPWWAIALSIVAAETSTLTIIGVPGLAYDTNFTFLQLVMGYLVGRVIISYLLLPHYFRGDLFTAYQLIERRFGGRLRSLTAGLFLLTRAAAEGVPYLCGCTCRRDRAGAASRQHKRTAARCDFDRHRHPAYAAVHLRRWNGRGHLDRCCTTRHLSGGHAGWPVHHSAPGARRMGNHSRAGGECRQVSRV